MNGEGGLGIVWARGDCEGDARIQKEEAVKEEEGEVWDIKPISFGWKEKGSHIRRSIQLLCWELDADWLLAIVIGY